MPWILAIMMFLSIISAASGLALAHALVRMQGELAGGQTVQIVEADASLRNDQVRRIAAFLGAQKNVSAVHIVPEGKLLDQIRPWIGTDAPADELPVPALIDMQLANGAGQDQMHAITQAVRRIAPTARIDAHEQYLGPVERLMRMLMWLAAGLVALMILVTGAVVTLAARSAHETHRATIDIMHLLGATDLQIARLFQRRMALDAIFGGALGLACATALLWLLGRHVVATDSELTQMVTLPPRLALLLPVIPVAGILLAMVTARLTVKRALERSL